MGMDNRDGRSRDRSIHRGIHIPLSRQKPLPRVAQGHPIPEHRQLPTPTCIGMTGPIPQPEPIMLAVIEQCGTCRYWKPIEEQGYHTFGVAMPAGHCRAGHPTNSGAVRWTVTPHDEYCGDWESK